MPTVRTDDIDTYYERRGDGPPVVFVHAGIVDHGQWLPQLEALSDRYTTIAYDLRGHGRTGGSTRDVYSIDLFVDDLEEFVDALDLEKPVIAGLSTGGCIAQVYAARHPERISGLVLADTFTPRILDWRDRAQFAALKAAVPPARLVGYERVEMVKNWIHERFDEGASGDYGRIERLREDAPKMETDEFAKVIRAIANFPGTEVDLSAITVPTLVVYGENDLGFVRRHAEELGAELPNATVREVPDAGHASNLDNPAFFSTVLREFLSAVHPLGIEPVPDVAIETDGHRTGHEPGRGMRLEALFVGLTALVFVGYGIVHVLRRITGSGGRVPKFFGPRTA